MSYSDTVSRSVACHKAIQCPGARHVIQQYSVQERGMSYSNTVHMSVACHTAIQCTGAWHVIQRYSVQERGMSYSDTVYRSVACHTAIHCTGAWYCEPRAAIVWGELALHCVTTTSCSSAWLHHSVIVPVDDYIIPWLFKWMTSSLGDCSSAWLHHSVTVPVDDYIIPWLFKWMTTWLSGCSSVQDCSSAWLHYSVTVPVNHYTSLRDCPGWYDTHKIFIRGCPGVVHKCDRCQWRKEDCPTRNVIGSGL